MKKLLAITSALVVAGAAQAAEYTLTFDQAASCASVAVCSDGSRLSQATGDVGGVVDVTYIDVINPANVSLPWWNLSYNDLRGVVWANGNDSASHARIEIKSLNGGAVTLLGMDFGAYPGTVRSTNIVVSALGGGTPLTYTGNVGQLPANTHTSFSPDVTAAGGIAIDWYNSAYNVGIDNVRFSVTPVPEPQTLAMLLAGLGIVAAATRRRKRL